MLLSFSIIFKRVQKQSENIPAQGPITKQFYEQFNLHYKNSKYKSHNHGNGEFQPCKHKYDKSYYW